MPGQKPIKSPAWSWFKAELERRLGKAEADALWAELAARRVQERIAKERSRAPRVVADLEDQIMSRREAGQSVARLEKQIARWQSLLGE